MKIFNNSDKPLAMTLLLSLVMLMIGTLDNGVSAEAVSRFLSVKDLIRNIEQCAEDTPDLVNVTTLATTPGGHRFIQVSCSGTRPESNPALLMVTGVEGTDLASPTVGLMWLQTLCREYSRNDSIKTLLDTTTLYWIPRLNPDAADAFFSSPRRESHLNRRPIDLDRDGRLSEDGEEDLDGNGLITQMRVKDSGGDWTPHPDYPDLMIPVDPLHHNGPRFRLYSEGRDSDRDGLFNEDGAGGVDINMNFSFQYPTFQAGSGPYAMSEPESEAVVRFCLDHPNIVSVFSVSPQHNLITPWDHQSDIQESNGDRHPILKVTAADHPVFKDVADRFRDHFRGHPNSVEKNGGWAQWAYFHAGFWSFSAPVWSPPDTNGNKSSDPNVALFRWIQEQKLSERFIPWTEISHPDFPDQTVHVGGFAPFAQNPPPDSLQTISDRLAPFLLEQLGDLPKLGLEEPTIESLGSSLYRISVRVLNTGWLPTTTEIGRRSRWLPPIRVIPELADSHHLIQGDPWVKIDGINGHSASRRVSWLVRIDDTTPLTVSCLWGNRECDRVDISWPE
jgi:hypothetical protein